MFPAIVEIIAVRTSNPAGIIGASVSTGASELQMISDLTGDGGAVFA